MDGFVCSITVFRGRVAVVVVTLLSVLTWSTPARASFHLMQIQEIIGGVNGDTTAQAIQLRERTGGQDLVSNAHLVVFDAAGLNPITLLTPPSNVGNGNTGATILFTTPNFSKYTSPALSADFTLSNPIPASYLAAGKLAWEDSSSTILWSVSWGGASYTGPNTGSTFNDANGIFGPAFGAPLPSSNLQALLFKGAATDPSLSNVVDYAVTQSPAVFTNNGGQSFTVVPEPSSMLLVSVAGLGFLALRRKS